MLKTYYLILCLLHNYIFGDCIMKLHKFIRLEILSVLPGITRRNNLYISSLNFFYDNRLKALVLKKSKEISIKSMKRVNFTSTHLSLYRYGRSDRAVQIVGNQPSNRENWEIWGEELKIRRIPTRFIPSRVFA